MVEYDPEMFLTLINGGLDLNGSENARLLDLYDFAWLKEKKLLEEVGLGDDSQE